MNDTLKHWMDKSSELNERVAASAVNAFDWLFRKESLVKSGQTPHTVGVPPSRKELEGAHPHVAGGHPGEDGAGQRAFAVRVRVAAKSSSASSTRRRGRLLGPGRGRDQGGPSAA